MNRASLAALLCAWGLVCAPVGAAPQPQVVDNFKTAAADGRPLGWMAYGYGGEATLTHNAQGTPSMKIAYKFTDPQGVIYLLCRERLRTKPWGFELTAKGAGKGELLGVMVREGVTDQLYEYRADTPLKETGWATRSIELKGAEKKLKTAEDGAGLRLDGLTLRKGPDTPDEGVLELSEVVAQCDVTAKQAAMVDIVTARPDGLFVGTEEPRPELIVGAVSGDRNKLSVEYNVTDGDGSEVGRGSDQVDVSTGEAARVPVKFTPRGAFGFYTVRATARKDGSERSATLRFCVLPPVPDGDGRNVAVDVRPHLAPTEPWYDLLLLTNLQRAGARAARVVLRWAELEPNQGQRSWTVLDHWVEVSKRAKLPLFVSVVDPPAWVLRGGADSLKPALLDLLREAAGHGGEAVIGWEVLREPNTPRYWPPKPQPMGYRALLADAVTTLRPEGRKVLVVNGGLRGFDRTFAGALLSSAPAPTDGLAIAVPASRHAFPYLPDEQRPSTIAQKALDSAKTWLGGTKRSANLWLTDVSVRTSPVEASKLGQAVELARCATLARSGGGWLLWHEAVDGSDAENRNGLLREDLQPKPALLALAANAAATYGAKFLGSPKNSPNLYLFTGPQGFVAVGWGAVPAPDGTTARNLWGADGPSAGDAPTYLSGKGVVTLMAR